MARRAILTSSRSSSARLEQESFHAERLVSLQHQLVPVDGSRRAVAASASIHRLHWLVELHDWQHNLIFAMVAAALLWGTHVAIAIEAWRRAHGASRSGMAAHLRRVRGVGLTLGVSIRASR